MTNHDLIRDRDAMVLRLGARTRYLLSWGLWSSQFRVETIIARTETLDQIKGVAAMLRQHKREEHWRVGGLGEYVTTGPALQGERRMYQRSQTQNVARGVRWGVYRRSFWVITAPDGLRWLLVPLELQRPIAHDAPLVGENMRPVNYWEIIKWHM